MGYDSPLEKKGDDAKELLLADLKYANESFWHNEETGEKRVKFFITLVTAVITALVAITGKEGIKDDLLKNLLVLYALSSLFIVGLVTLFRLIRRNEVTDGFKKDMDDIRQRFIDYYDDCGVLIGYSPFKPSGKTTPLRKFGGLTHTVAAINSLILTAITSLYLSKKNVIYSREGPIAILFGFFVTFVIQVIYIRYAEKRSKEERHKSDFTHAGGVVVRFESGAPQFLLITAKNNPDHWVLPKGHIKKNESPAKTAVREVWEETGVIASIIESLGSIRFSTEKEVVNARFYLMEYIADKGSPENRQKKWCTYEKGTKLLSFKDARKLIREARRTTTKLAKT
jgi:bis(5'-nucleosidyl)-tetraphosphatase